MTAEQFFSFYFGVAAAWAVILMFRPTLLMSKEKGKQWNDKVGDAKNSISPLAWATVMTFVIVVSSLTWPVGFFNMARKSLFKGK